MVGELGEDKASQYPSLPKRGFFAYKLPGIPMTIREQVATLKASVGKCTAWEGQTACPTSPETNTRDRKIAWNAQYIETWRKANKSHVPKRWLEKGFERSRITTDVESDRPLSADELEAAINFPHEKVSQAVADNRELTPWLFAQVLAHPEFSVNKIGDWGTDWTGITESGVDDYHINKLLNSKAGRALTPQELGQAMEMAKDLIGKREIFYMPPPPSPKRRRFSFLGL